MLRVSDETRDRVQQVAREDYGGATAEETVQRLLDEHWMQQAIADVENYRQANPDGWAEYLAEAAEWEQNEAPITDGWTGA